MNRRFTWVELLVVIVIIAVSLAILIPVLNSQREAQRRATCMNNSHQIGLAFLNYASTFNNSFPQSASVRKDADGTLTVGGWSFLVRLLSFMDNVWPYRSVPVPGFGDPESPTHPATIEMIESQPIEFLCPCGPHGSVRSASGQCAGITNYKAMGASTRGSLVMVVTPQATPPYGTMTPIRGTFPLHPDGAIFPAASNIPAAACLDGTSHAVFTIETMDEIASRWTVGKEATLVGLPQTSSPKGTTPQAPYTFFVQPGFDNTSGPDSAVAKAGFRTFLSYDFNPGGADAGKYEDPGFGPTPSAYGPSSMHPGVVVAGFGDASVQAIAKQVDAATLLFMITKNGGDAFLIP
jgi:hypothetical protein